MIDTHTLHRQALDIKHAELLAMVKMFVKWEISNDSSGETNLAEALIPTTSEELLI